MNGSGAKRAAGSHRPSCAQRIRLRALFQAGEPAEPLVPLLHSIARQIRDCCGHSPLKAYRLAWGWTVDQAIQAFHQMCSRDQLGARGLGERSWLGWEAGGRPNDDYRELLCRLFQTSGVQLGFAADYTPVRPSDTSSGNTSDVASNTSRPFVAVRDLADKRPSEAGDLTNRRQAFQVLGSTAAGIAAGGLFAESAAEAMEYTRRVEASEVGPRTLEHLELVIAGLAAAFAYTPPAEMFPQARWYRRRVADLVDSRRYTLREGRELYRCAGWLSIILGWLSHDLGDSLAGEVYCLDAWEHGWQAEHGEICAWAMDASATIAMYNNHPTAARDAALKGLGQAPKDSPAAVRVVCQLTRAYARLGDRDRFDDALADTQHRLDGLSTPGSGLFSADAGRIASYAATSSIWLGQPQQAVSYAEEALTYYAGVGPEQRSPTREAISRLDLGLALVHLKTPDGAAEEAMRALGTERVTGSMLVRAGELDVALRQHYPGYRGTADFHEQYLALSTQAGRPRLSS
jgi:hypothetical protein